MSDLYGTLKTIRSHTYNEGDEKLLYPLMSWISGNIKDLLLCNFINKHFFYSPHKRLTWLLAKQCQTLRFPTKYPKARAEKSKEMELLKPYLKKIYQLSEREFKLQLPIFYLMLKNNSFIEELNQLVGFSKSECRTLKLKFKTFKVNRKPKSKGLFGKW